MVDDGHWHLVRPMALVCFTSSGAELLRPADAQHFGWIQWLFAHLHLALAVILVALGARIYVWRTWRGQWPPISTVLRPFTAPSEEDIKVREIADVRHQELWHVIFKIAHMSSLLLLVILLIRMASRASSSSNSEHEVILSSSNEDFGYCVYMAFASTIFILRHSWLSKRSLYAYLAITQFFISVPLILTCVSLRTNQIEPGSLRAVDWNGARHALCRLLLSMHCTSIPFVVLTNLATSILVGYLRREIHMDIGCEWDRDDVKDEIITFLFVCTLFMTFRQLHLQQIRATLAAKSSDNVVSAIETILYGTCDAVVHMDEDLVLKKASKELDAMVLYQDSGVRHNFLNVLSSDSDRDKVSDFLRLVSQNSGGGRLPASQHVMMKDIYNTPVPVQLYHARCTDSMDEVFHIVGIRECSDRPHSERPAALSGEMEGSCASPGDPKALPELLKRSEQVLSLIREDSISELSSVSQGPEEALQTASPPEYQPGQAIVWIDPNDPGFAMRKCTPEFFVRLGGPTLKAGSQLLSWTPRRDREWLLESIQGAVNDLAVQGSAHSVVIELRLRPPGLATHLAEVEAVLTLDASGGQDFAEDLDEALPLVKLTCREVNMRCRPKQTPQQGLPPKPASSAVSGEATPPILSL